MTLTPDPSTAPSRTPREALNEIRGLCDRTSWILSANDVRPILDSVQPFNLEDQEERMEYLQSLEVDLDWACDLIQRLSDAGITVTIR